MDDGGSPTTGIMILIILLCIVIVLLIILLAKPEIRKLLLGRIQKALGKDEILSNTNLVNLADDDGFITVYRGHTDDIEYTSASWTANEDFAHRFGKRHALFDNLPYYYVTKGRVNIDDIVMYITEKGEDEIIVLPKFVKEKTREIFEF